MNVDNKSKSLKNPNKISIKNLCHVDILKRFVIELY